MPASKDGYCNDKTASDTIKYTSIDIQWNDFDGGYIPPTMFHTNLIFLFSDLAKKSSHATTTLMQTSIDLCCHDKTASDSIKYTSIDIP